MRTRHWLALAMVAASSAQAQAPRGFSDCNAPKELRLSNGEQMRVNCDFAVALNPEAAARLEDQRTVIAGMKAVLDENRADREALLKRHEQLVSELKSIQQTQDTHYEALKAKYVEADKIAVESMEHTRNALRLAQGARLSSYLTAGMIGGLGGGLSGSQLGGHGGLEIGAGAALGALVGVGINWALLHFMGAQ